RGARRRGAGGRRRRPRGARRIAHRLPRPAYAARRGRRLFERPHGAPAQGLRRPQRPRRCGARSGLRDRPRHRRGPREGALGRDRAGKTGARELNYLSDVDVMHVVAPAAHLVGEDGEFSAEVEADMVAVGAALARELARACSERTGEGSLWQVDANLRPEGKDGPLVRTLASYRRYYTEWAKSWEFQALLKARAAAGDRELGGGFETMVEPWVWQASTREGFV